MPPSLWHIHFQGETLGPLTTDVVKVMLRQNRLQFTDWIWTEGHERWSRIAEVPAFNTLLPPYPSTPPPKSSKAPIKPVPEKEPPPPAVIGPASPRVCARGKVTAEGHSSFALVDLSEGGAFVKAARPLAVGTEIRFLLEADFLTDTLEMTGIVIRQGVSSSGEKGFAIQFTRVNPAHRRLIQQYVQSAKAAA